MQPVSPTFEPLELRDPLVDPAGPAGGEFSPSPRLQARARRGQLPQLFADLVERHPDPLGEDDEGDAAQHRRRVAAVPGAGTLGPR